MLTPHIIKDDEVFGKMSAAELKKAATYRVGVSKGMMPWGRERLAEGEYEAALAELKKPNPNNQKVLWHLDCATNLNPTFSEAIELKQRTTGREVTTSDNSSIRSFVQRMILADQPAGSMPPANRTEDMKSPVKPGNTSASNTDKPADTVADNDLSDETPLDEEDFEKQPEADTVVNAPATTQPSTPAVAEAKPTTQPSTPAVAEAKPTTQPSTPAAVADTKEQAPSTDASAKAEDKKATDNGAAPSVTVTELPVEEVKPDAPTADDNK